MRPNRARFKVHAFLAYDPCDAKNKLGTRWNLPVDKALTAVADFTRLARNVEGAESSTHLANEKMDLEFFNSDLRSEECS